MAKPETDFVDDDLAMARRALWLLDDHPPSCEQPPPDLDLSRFGQFVVAGGVLEPLAHFGQTRRDDALLGAKRSKDAATELEPTLLRMSGHRERSDRRIVNAQIAAS